MILISVLDDSFFSNPAKDGRGRVRRVSNIKQSLSESKVINESNLDIYVATMSRAKIIGERFLIEGARNFQTDQFSRQLHLGFTFISGYYFLEVSIQRTEESSSRCRIQRDT